VVLVRSVIRPQSRPNVSRHVGEISQ
jgi:hypothetical protein